MRLSEADAAHLLRRAAFGGTPSEVASYTGMTRAAAVDQLLSSQGNPPEQPPNFASLGIGPRAMTSAMDSWLERLFNAASRVNEKQLLFWHAHFAISYRKIAVGPITWESHAMMRNRGMGDFFRLLRDVSFSTAMVLYLDNETNMKHSPQENFARELMELHTVGNGQFSEPDVVSMARAWTGHNIAGTYRDGDIRYRFSAADHDSGQKTLFGIRRNWDAIDTLHELTSGSKKTDTARFLARKLFEFYVHENPGQAVVNTLGAELAADDLHIGRFLRRLFLSDEFWSAGARYSLVHWPVGYITSLSRALDVSPGNTFARGLMGSMGMTLFQPPSVNGWGGNDYWMSTSNVWAKESWLRQISTKRPRSMGLNGQSSADATSTLLRAMGVYEPSAATTNSIRAWFDSNDRLSGPALERKAVQFAGLLPEVQLA